MKIKGMRKTRQMLRMHKKQAENKGFTIVELLVSMTITLIIVGLLLGMTKIAVGAWLKTNNKAKSSRLAQEVFETVGRDLEGVVIREGNSSEWLNVVDSGLSDTDLGPSGKEIVNALDVSFFTAATDRYDGQIGTPSDDGGDVSIVRYRLVYQDIIDRDSGSKPVYSLYRQRIDPLEVFSILGEVDLETALSSQDSDFTVEDNILSENVYDFTLSFNFEYIKEEAGQPRVKGYKRVVMQSEGTNNSLSIKGDEILLNDDSLEEVIEKEVGGVDIVSLRLFSADISVFVISDGGMKRIRIEPVPANEFSDFLEKNGELYTKSVLLP